LKDELELFGERRGGVSITEVVAELCRFGEAVLDVRKRWRGAILIDGVPMSFDPKLDRDLPSVRLRVKVSKLTRDIIRDAVRFRNIAREDEATYWLLVLGLYLANAFDAGSLVVRRVGWRKKPIKAVERGGAHLKPAA